MLASGAPLFFGPLERHFQLIGDEPRSHRLVFGADSHCPDSCRLLAQDARRRYTTLREFRADYYAIVELSTMVEAQRNRSFCVSSGAPLRSLSTEYLTNGDNIQRNNYLALIGAGTQKPKQSILILRANSLGVRSVWSFRGIS